MEFPCIHLTSRTGFNGTETEGSSIPREKLIHIVIYQMKDFYSTVRKHPLVINKLPAWTKIFFTKSLYI